METASAEAVEHAAHTAWIEILGSEDKHYEVGSLEHHHDTVNEPDS